MLAVQNEGYAALFFLALRRVGAVFLGRPSRRPFNSDDMALRVLRPAPKIEHELAELEATSALPEAPAEAQVEEWVLDAYRRSWRQ